MNFFLMLCVVFVFLLNVFGWVVLFGFPCVSCSSEGLILLSVQCSEIVFLAFQCMTIYKQAWFSTEWLLWGLVLFIVACSGLFETWIFWQEDATNNKLFDYTLKLHIDFAAKQFDFFNLIQWFVAISCLMPLFLIFVLVFVAISQSANYSIRDAQLV